MIKQHMYHLNLSWTGNTGSGTSGYRQYSRDHEFSAPGKPVVLTSSDPHFRGDASRYNPEELLVASLSSCHMLWYLHLCADAGIIIVAYSDAPSGTIDMEENGSGKFTEVILRPLVMIADASMTEKANALHKEAHKMCFIANSVNFPVHHQAKCIFKTR